MCVCVCVCFVILPMPHPGPEAQDEDSSDSDADEQSTSQDPKDAPRQPSGSHAPRAASCRAAAVWCTDSASDDSRRWSDQLSLDEKDGFIFVNYSEGQTRAHLQGPLNHPQPSPMEVRNYSRLKPGNLESAVGFLLLAGGVRAGGVRRRALVLPAPRPCDLSLSQSRPLQFLTPQWCLLYVGHFLKKNTFHQKLSSFTNPERFWENGQVTDYR